MILAFLPEMKEKLFSAERHITKLTSLFFILGRRAFISLKQQRFIAERFRALPHHQRFIIIRVGYKNKWKSEK